MYYCGTNEVNQTFILSVWIRTLYAWRKNGTKFKQSAKGLNVHDCTYDIMYYTRN